MNSRPIPLEVIPQDIDLALAAHHQRNDPLTTSCPVVHAYKRAFPKAEVVGCGITIIYSIQRRWWGGYQVRQYSLSEDLQKVTRAFPFNKIEPTIGTITPV